MHWFACSMEEKQPYISTLQDFIFDLRGKENLFPVTRMTNTNIHTGPDTDARHTQAPPLPSAPPCSPLPLPPPPPTHTQRQACIMPVYRCEDISTPYHRLRSAWSTMGEQKNTTWKMQLGRTQGHAVRHQKEKVKLVWQCIEKDKERLPKAVLFWRLMGRRRRRPETTLEKTLQFEGSAIDINSWKMCTAYRASFWHILERLTVCFSSYVCKKKKKKKKEKKSFQYLRFQKWIQLFL